MEETGDSMEQQATQPRRVKTRHIILAVMCLMYFISYIDRVNIAVAGPIIRHEMGLTSGQLGLVFYALRIRMPSCRSWAAGLPTSTDPSVCLLCFRSYGE